MLFKYIFILAILANGAISDEVKPDLEHELKQKLLRTNPNLNVKDVNQLKHLIDRGEIPDSLLSENEKNNLNSLLDNTLLSNVEDTQNSNIAVTPTAQNSDPSDILKKLFPNNLVFQEKPEESKNENKKVANLPEMKFNSEEMLVRNRLLDYMKGTKAEIEKKIQMADQIHETHKNNAFYRLGYMVNFISRTGDSLAELYKQIQKNDGLTTLKILNAYDQMRKVNKYLELLLTKLHDFRTGSLETPEQRKSVGKAPIAWSYYDEN